MHADSSADPVVHFESISKRYDNGVLACDDVTLSIAPGEVHAIVGENGAGKSTLMNLLYGMHRPSTGSIEVGGQRRQFSSPLDAIAAGVGMVHQSFMLVPSFTIASNVVLGTEPISGITVDDDEAVRLTNELASQYGLDVPATARVADIAVGTKQRVEILKALYRGAQVLILDEPTAVLTPQEADQLFDALRALVNEGRTILFISHKLREVMRVSDSVSVMRRGRLVGTVASAATSHTELGRMMVGRDVSLVAGRAPKAPGEPRLAISSLTVRGDLGTVTVDDLSLEVRAGEILGVAGVEGNGQTELAQAITGLRPIEAGVVEVDGDRIDTLDVAGRRQRGLSHIPEDRHHDGAALSETIADNLIVDRVRQPAWRRGRFLLRRSKILEHAEELIDQYDIRAVDGTIPVGALSGGNIQKVIVARELSAQPTVLVAAQPTRGVDIGAIEFIYSQIRAAREAGSAVLLISADLGEVLTLSDRVVVIRNGKIVTEFDRPDEVTEQQVGLAMLGVVEQPVVADGGRDQTEATQ